MKNAIAAELRKYFTTRLWWGMGLAITFLSMAFALLFAILFTLDSFTQSGAADGQAITYTDVQLANSVYTAGLSVGYLLMLTVGVMQIGSEYRHKTITSTFLAIPHRARVLGAKIISLLIIAAGYALISILGSVAIGSLVLTLRGADPFPGIEVLRTLALSLLVLGLWALIGLGIGILIPNQVAALLIGVGVAWIAEPLLGFGLTFWEFGRDHISPYLPTQATNAIIDTVNQSPDSVRLSWWLAAIVLAAYAAVLAAIGTWRIVRSDIS